jgi:hypothetical protein
MKKRNKLQILMQLPGDLIYDITHLLAKFLDIEPKRVWWIVLALVIAAISFFPIFSAFIIIGEDVSGSLRGAIGL